MLHTDPVCTHTRTYMQTVETKAAENNTDSYLRVMDSCYFLFY